MNISKHNFKKVTFCFSILFLFVIQLSFAQCDANFGWESNNAEVFFFTEIGDPDATYFWDFGDGNTSTEFDPLHVYEQGQNNFVYEVILIVTLPDGTSCTAVEEIELESVECTSMFNTEIGEDFLTVYFEDTSWGLITDWFWDFGDGNTSIEQHPIHVYDQEGEYDVTLTINCHGGEINSFPMQVQVGEIFQACDATFFHEWNGTQFYFYPEIFIDDATYHWDFGDGATSSEQYPSHNYTNSEPGTEYWVVLLVTLPNGDVCEYGIYVIVEPVECTAMFNQYEISNDGLTFQFEDTSWGIITSWLWDFGDGTTSTEQYPIHTYDAYGNYIVTLIIECDGGISNTFEQLVDVNNNVECDAGFWYEQELLDVTFFSFFEAQGAIYNWDFGDGNTSTEQFPINTYPISQEPQEFIVVLTIALPDGTTCTHEEWIFVEPLECNPMFEYEASVDNELEIQFIDTSWGIPLEWLWDFGDGSSSTEQNPVHTYDAPGAYDVTLTITCIAGEVETMMMPAIVGDFVFCEPWFYYEPNFDIAQYFFYPQMIGDDIIYNWDFGDGATSTEQFPVHTYNQTNDPQGFVVTLTITLPDGQTCSYEEWIEVNPIECTAMFDYGPAPDNDLVMQFWDTSWGVISDWAWDFGDGNTSTEQNPQHEYDSPGTYIVTLTITCSNGETNSFSNDIFTYGPIDCDATFGAYFISDLQVYFETFVPLDPSFEFYWDFGDGEISNQATPTHGYATPGIYWVFLEIFTPNGELCFYDMELHVGEGDPDYPFNCEAFFGFEQTDNPMVFEFINESYTETDDISYIWSFGDGGTSTDENPTHQYDLPGEYIVTLTIIGDDCESTFPMVIYVEDESFYPEGCQSLFMMAPTNIGYFFYDMSEGDVTSRLWNFGDGNLSTAQNPFHQYQAPGEYEVTLEINTAAGCESSFKMIMNEDGMMGNAVQAYMVSTNSIDDVSLTTIFPNPVEDQLSIEFELDQQKEITFEIITINGVVVKTATSSYGTGQQTKSFDMSHLPSSLYIIRLSADNQEIRYRIAKF